MANIESPNSIITALLNTLSSISAPEVPPDTNFHSSVIQLLSQDDQSKVKKVMLTLHFLFPHELLPALDLLDRKLVTCLRTKHDNEEPTKVDISTFYVQSASASSSARAGNTSVDSPGIGIQTGRFRKVQSLSSTFYEVNLDGWNCSCPAFAFSSFKLITGADENASSSILQDSSHEIEQIDGDGDGVSWRFGGSVAKRDALVPMCKHILAVMLAVAAPGMFSDSIVRKEADPDEFAGWAAGWGEK